MGTVAFVEGALLAPITGYSAKTVMPEAGGFAFRPLTRVAPFPAPKMKPSALPTLNV